MIDRSIESHHEFSMIAINDCMRGRAGFKHMQYASLSLWW